MYKPVTHYDPTKPSYDPYGEDSFEYGYCKTLLSEDYDNSTNDKNLVTCKKCIKLFDVADKEMERVNEDILKYMEGFVDFHSNK